jgi:hypothetical protein
MRERGAEKASRERGSEAGQRDALRAGAIASRQLTAIPEAAEIGSYDAELSSEPRRELAPNDVGMRMAMQEEDRRA